MREAPDPTGTATGTGPRYGWLGAKQRAADTGTGLILMGVRVYAPLLGRFLQTDPVYGGNESSYGYPNNPITMFDLDGRWGWAKKAWDWTKRNRWNIALVAASFVPGVGAAALGARALSFGFKAYKAGKTFRSGFKAGGYLKPRLFKGQGARFKVDYYSKYGSKRYLKLDRADAVRGYSHWVRGKYKAKGGHGAALQHYRWWGRKVD